MNLNLLAFLLGISSIIWLHHFVSFWVSGSILFCLLLLAIILQQVVKPNGLRLTIACLLAMLGLSYVTLVSKHELAWQLSPSLIGKDVRIKAYIEGIPNYSDDHVSFQVHVNAFQGKVVNTRFRLNWYFKKNEKPHLETGDYWEWQVRLKSPHGFQNPGGFDYEKWLFAKGVRATGYVLNKKNNYLIKRGGEADFIDHIRQRIRNTIIVSVKNHNIAALMVGLSVGLRNDMSAQQWQVLANTGTSHLLAISGLHIGLVAGLFFFLIGFLWRHIPNAPLLMASPRIAAIAGLLVAFIYSALAGFALPTQRALIMLAVIMGAIFFRRHLRVGQALGVGLFLILLIEPLGILTIGFWLSFLAVACLIYGLSGRLKPSKRWKLFQAQWAITVTFFPLTLLFFQKVSLLSFAINIISIPWVGFISVPLTLIGALSSLLSVHSALTQFVLHIAALSLVPFWSLVSHVAAMPALLWQQAMPISWVLVVSLIGSLLILAPRGFPARWVGIIFLLPLFLLHRQKPVYGEIWFTLLDVGQGLAALVQTQHHTLLYDTGPRFNANSNAGERVLLPFFRQIGVDKLDGLVLSHGDSDHSGGLLPILKNFQVTHLFSSVEKLSGQSFQPCLAGHRWEWDGVQFEFLYPNRERLSKGNNSSCVLRISAGDKQILLTGDIEAPAERYLLKSAHQKLSANILVAPHHGSKSSSIPAFIQAVHPAYTLFATGYYNRFHFPNQQIVNAYQLIGSQTLNTAYTGAIFFKLSPKQGIEKPKLYRQENCHIWQDCYNTPCATVFKCKKKLFPRLRGGRKECAT